MRHYHNKKNCTPSMPCVKPNVQTTSWHEVPTPDTSLQRSAYILMCTQWLVSPCERIPAPFVDSSLWTESNNETPHSLRDHAVVARTHTEWRTHAHATCLMCNARTHEAVVVNPFTPRCIVTVCAACRGITEGTEPTDGGGSPDAAQRRAWPR